MAEMKKFPADGYLREWLVLGSFPGFPKDLMVQALIPELSCLPAPGQKQSGLAWKALQAEDRIINLESLTRSWAHHSQCCAYAHAYVHSPSAGEALLSLGSDDGAVMWFNGERVFAFGGARGNTPDQDRVPVSLMAGWNRVLIKVLQYDGGWSFCLRLLDRFQQPVKGLAYSLKDPLKGRWPKPDKSKLPLAFILQPPLPSECAQLLPGQSLKLELQVQNMGAAPLKGVALELRAEGMPAKALALPPLAPLAGHAFRLEMPGHVWARSYSTPLKLKASLKGKAMSLEQELKTRLGSAFSAAAGMPHAYLRPAEAAKLQALRAEIALAPEILEESAALEAAVSRLCLGLLKAEAGLARPALEAASALLTQIQAGLKGQSVLLVGHAHIDMNWLWRWDETVQCCADTFSQALRFMGEFPQFRFTQSQAACYEAMQNEEPEIFAGIRKAVKAGKWNVVGGMWVEGDTNLCSGEAIARSCLLAQNYFGAQLGVRARVGWLPDNFGHVAQLPQILRLAGMDSFYHSRTGPEPQLYWWEGLDGSRVLAKTGQGYNDAVSPALRRQPLGLPKQAPQQMFVYGVGDHGGGPTRRDIEGALAMQGRKLFPEIKFASADEYFERVRPQADGLHLQKGELGYIFEGCYTNIATLKQGNRDLENALQAAEALAFAAKSLGLAWPKATLAEAWKILAFNQFHDILPGSAIHPSNDDSRALYARGLQLARQVRSKSLRLIAGKVALAAGEGSPIVVFNPLGWERDEIAEAELIFTERFHSVKMLDPQGREIPVQVVRTRDFGCDFHVWVRFKARAVPAFGYQCYRLIPETKGEPLMMVEWGDSQYEPIPLPKPKPGATSLLRREGFKIKNPYLEVEFDPKDGSITSLRRLKGGKAGPNLFSGKGGNALGIYMEKPHPMSAWTLDPTASGPLPLKALKALEIVQEGPQSVTLRAELAWGRSTFRLLTTVHADSPRIDCVLKADWLETGSATSDGPMLRALWNLAKEPKALTSDVPYGVLDRAPGREVPAQKWVSASGLALYNRGKYGHSLEKDCLRLSLLRSSYDPDGFPDLGHHEMHWALEAHDGDYRAAGLARKGLSYNVPLECHQARAQKGPLPETHSFLPLKSSPDFVPSGLKLAEDGKSALLRGYDSGGKGAAFSLKAGKAEDVNLLEEPFEKNSVRAKGGWASLKVKPWGIASLKLREG
jgi:alpha-mannosidase